MGTHLDRPASLPINMAEAVTMIVEVDGQRSIPCLPGFNVTINGNLHTAAVILITDNQQFVTHR